MADYEFIGRAKLSLGYSFPLKRSLLDAFLDEHEINLVTGVAYCGPSQDQRVFSAAYYGPTRRGMAHTLTLWINAVPSSIRKFVAIEIEDKWLDGLGNWLVQFADSSRLLSQTDHRCDLHYNDVRDDGTCHLEMKVDAPRQTKYGGRVQKK